jgi:hypothetical protein
LFLKDSRIVEYLREIGEGAEIELELGEYPAIEALAFAVLEMKSHGRVSGVTNEQVRIWAEKYSLSLRKLTEAISDRTRAITTL